VLSLHPTKIRALISLPNLANRRGTPVSQLRASLNVGEKLEDLVVVSRNPAQGFVIVAHKPKIRPTLPLKGSSISMDTVQIGQIIGGRVLRHDRKGAFIKITTHISGLLYPTDTCDNYESGTPFLPVDSLVKAVVTGIDREKSQLSLSTRHSRMYPSRNHQVVDHEVQSLDDLKVGENIRGFIKSVAEHGLFVMLGREIDARVQIKELFDDVSASYHS
jgi:rRNA biogenesis protein RRP5